MRALVVRPHHGYQNQARSKTAISLHLPLLLYHRDSIYNISQGKSCQTSPCFSQPWSHTKYLASILQLLMEFNCFMPRYGQTVPLSFLRKQYSLPSHPIGMFAKIISWIIINNLFSWDFKENLNIKYEVSARTRVCLNKEEDESRPPQKLSPDLHMGTMHTRPAHKLSRVQTYTQSPLIIS